MNKQTVLVTGAASGIGTACPHKLLGQGHDVVAVDLDKNALAAVLPGESPALLLLEAGVSRAQNCADVVQAAVTHFGRLDALIHWAAVHSSTHWTDLGADEINRVLATNVTGMS